MEHTRNEIVAAVAPILDTDLDKLAHVIIIAVTYEGTIIGGSSECREHSAWLCHYAIHHIFQDPSIETDPEGNITLCAFLRMNCGKQI